VLSFDCIWTEYKLTEYKIKGYKMKITILNGSPKGDQSVTLQYILYIQKHNPQHDYQFINVSQKINSYEKDISKFNEVIEKIKISDAVIWITPVFVLLIPSQLKRFIELIKKNGAEGAFKDKYTSVVTSSIHFYDHTANNYMHAICDARDMKFFDFYSVDMWDLFASKKRKQLLLFAENFFYAVENKTPTMKKYLPVGNQEFTYTPGEASKKIDPAGKKILIVTDSTDEKKNIGKMIKRFKNSFSDDIEIISISDIDIKGPCISCLRCGYDNICIYKDGFAQFWNTKVSEADVLIFAGTITDRYLSAKWKLLFDRSFFMNHTPSISGKQIGYLISGPLNQNQNLKQILQAYAEFQESNLVEFVTDEYADSSALDKLISDLAERSLRYSKQGFIKPGTFLAEGGMKLFRDDVWGRLRFVFQADHRHYQKNGFYDSFPQNDKFAKKLNRKFMFITKFKKIRIQFYKRITTELVRPLQNIASDPEK